MWVLALVVFVAVLAVGVWAGRRHAGMDPTCLLGTERLGVRDPRETPWGPPGSI